MIHFATRSKGLMRGGERKTANSLPALYTILTPKFTEPPPPTTTTHTH